MSRRLRPVSGLVDRLLRGLGLATEVDRVDALRVWRTAAVGVLGADADTTRAVRVDGTVLVVAVPSPAWSAEIRLRESEILARLAELSPRSGITAVRCVPQIGGRSTPRSHGQGASAP